MKRLNRPEREARDKAFESHMEEMSPGCGLARKVGQQGHIYIGDRPWRVSQALTSHMVRLERIDQRVLVYFRRTLVQEIDLSGDRSTAVERSPR